MRVSVTDVAVSDVVDVSVAVNEVRVVVTRLTEVAVVDETELRLLLVLLLLVEEQSYSRLYTE